jgi:folate-binding protein YgfZ
MDLVSTLYSPLPNLGSLHVEGPDARAFLHAQLSQHVDGLTADRAPLAGWHDAQGRVRALFRVVPLVDAWLLFTGADMVDSLLERLRRFVLRSHVAMRNATADWSGAALLGDVTARLEAGRLPVDEERDAAARFDGVVCVRVGPGVLHAFAAPERLARLTGSLPRADGDAARVAEIRLGLPEISPATEGRYLPQMLNLDLLGALALDKGCYPGQEIIIRAQHRGTVKRRMRRFRGPLSRLLVAGEELVDAKGNAAGEVIRAAYDGARIELLAVVRTDQPAGALRLSHARASDAWLERAPLPYERSS